MIGLARRAGKLVFGTEMVRDAVRSEKNENSGKRPLLVFVSSDASENTLKRISDCCFFYSVPLVKADVTSEELGRMIGKTSDVACVAMTDKNMSDAVKGKIDESMFVRAD